MGMNISSEKPNKKLTLCGAFLFPLLESNLSSSAQYLQATKSIPSDFVL